MFEQIERQLAKKQLAEALLVLDDLARSTQNFWAVSRIDEFKIVYEQMLNFAMRGIDDAQREAFFLQLMQQAYELYDVLRELHERQESAFFEYKYKRENANAPMLKACIERWHSLQDETALAGLLAEAFEGDKRTAKQADLASVRNDLFAAVFVHALFTKEDCRALAEFLNDTSVDDDSRSVIVSALMLNLLSAFQAEKMEVLLDVCRCATDRVRQRALVAVVVACQRYAVRMDVYPHLIEKMQHLASDSVFVDELATAVCHLIRSTETEAVNRKIQEDLLPEMMRLSPKLNEKWNNARAHELDDEAAMEEMQELFDETGLSDKLRQLGEMQREGTDVYLSTFATLKTFPFFGEAMNWFLPFSPKNQALKQLFDRGDEFVSLLMSNNMMCDSDKYSFCFSLLQLPENQLDFMKQNLKHEIEQLKLDENDRKLTDSKLIFSLQTNSYVQSVYRFYKLFPQKLSYNPFVHLSALSEVDFLWSMFDAEHLLTIADFYFAQKMYADALSIFARAEAVKSSDVALLRKTAYAYQRVGEPATALRIYERVELLAPEHKWTLRQMAACHKSLGDFAAATACYQRLVELNPDDYKALMNVANCLFEQEKYAEALALYFKIDYFNPDNLTVVRAVAWCAFLCEKWEQAENYFEKIGARASVLDLVRAAFCAFAQKNFDEAIARFRRAYSAAESDEAFWSAYNSVPNANADLTEFLKLQLKKIG